MEVEKDQFQAHERLLRKWFKWICLGVSVPFYGSFIVGLTYALDAGAAAPAEILICSNLYVLCSCVFVTGAYSSSALRMIYFMYQYHRFEFTIHRKRMIKLYVFTMISLLATLV